MYKINRKLPKAM